MWKKAEGKNLPVRFECDGPIPERIQSDPMRLKQILINLIGNAIKFTESGSVRVVTRCIKRGSGKSHLQFEVIDTGIGMTEKQLERLFQPFSQADSSTTRQFGGTGLGLTISKRLTEALGGSLSVDSVLNQGSTFTVAVATGPLDGVRMIEKTEPLSAEPSSPPLEDGVGMMPLLNGRILLAEDGPDNQRLLGFVLRKSGAEVTIANNGEEACRIAWEEKVGGHPFDLVLMDMQMPVMDGYTATETLRRRGFEGPILALTAHAMDGCEAKCRKAGCDGYLTKPIERKHFLETITGFLAESRSGMDPHPPK
jgi:Amt family ammonium transporter